MFARTASRPLRQLVRTQKRRMGGGGAPVPTEGFEGQVRKIFPKEWQLSLAIIGGYFGLYLFSKILPGGKKKEAPAVAASSSTDGMPSIESAEFGEWLGKEGNFEKLFA